MVKDECAMSQTWGESVPEQMFELLSPEKYLEHGTKGARRSDLRREVRDRGTTSASRESCALYFLYLVARVDALCFSPCSTQLNWQTCRRESCVLWKPLSSEGISQVCRYQKVDRFQRVQ